MPCDPQHVTGANSQSALENRNDVTSHKIPGFKMMGAPEVRMLWPRPIPPPFGEISGILPTSSDGDYSPSNPQDDSPALASSDATPQESSCTTCVAQEIDDEAAKSSPPDSTAPFLPLAPTHALTTIALPSPATTNDLGMAAEDVVRTDDKALLLMQTADPAEATSLLNDATASSEGHYYTAYYWMGDFDSKVVHYNEAKFTPSPRQMFYRLSIVVCELTVKYATQEECRNPIAHCITSPVTSWTRMLH